MLKVSIDHKKSARFDMRMDPSLKQILKKAADIQGCSSLSDFIMNCAFKEATRVIKDFEVIVLGQKDQEVFVKSLLSPQQPSNTLVSAVKDYKRFVTKPEKASASKS